jgi:Asp-tRNA(Asn)/Glu-tRNA(Gln) amidotransferase A subunit family amidase
VNPWRARSLIGYVGRTTDDAGYLAMLKHREALRVSVLKTMADERLDAIFYATFDAPPTKIADDVLTNPRPNDGYGRGDNRGLSPSLGFPALTVPAGFTPDSLPVGIELLGRPFSEAQLLAIGYAYERRTGHRRAPHTAPVLPR